MAGLAKVSRTFTQELGRLQRGQLDSELTDASETLVQEMVFVHSKSGGKPKGRITIIVDFTLDRGVMDVVADFQVKSPKRVRGRSVLYPDADGKLYESDPQQLALGELREVGMRDGDMREVREMPGASRVP